MLQAANTYRPSGEMQMVRAPAPTLALCQPLTFTDLPFMVVAAFINASSRMRCTTPPLLMLR